MARTVKLGDSMAIREKLIALKPFQITSGNMFGVLFKDALALSSGDIPESFRSQMVADTPDYIVYSYTTPIAWHGADGRWHVPDVIYSLTTTQHQDTIKYALPTRELDGPHVSLRSGHGKEGRYGPRGGANGDGMTQSPRRATVQHPREAMIAQASRAAARESNWEGAGGMRWFPIWNRDERLNRAHP